MSGPTTPRGPVGPTEANDLLAAGAVLVDVREDSEWQAGHAPEAVHLPLGELVARYRDLPGGRPLVMVCRVGGRSARATAFLVGEGLDAVNLEGGMKAWAAAGLAVEAPGGAPGVVA